jgi:TnpA family transposase
VAAGFLSEEQVARYGRFAGEPSAGELERFFRLDEQAWVLIAQKRRDHNRLGFAVQWGTVRTLGRFLAQPADVPATAVAFVADQLKITDASCITEYGQRGPTQHEHAREIRRECGYREFAEGEAELRAFVATRAWATDEGPRALFDRTVVWLLEQRVLLPGITVLARLVAEVRAVEHERLWTTLADAVSPELRRRLEELLDAPAGARTSTLDRWRGAPSRVSGQELARALRRVDEIRRVGTGAVEVTGVPAVKLMALARYGMTAKAPALRELTASRRAATLLATVRELGTASVDDALDLFDVLMATRLLAQATRRGNDERLRSLPRLRRAAATVAAAARVLLEVPEASAERPVSVAELWSEIERQVGREQLAAAVATVREFVPDQDADDDAEWRAELVKRYASVRGFIGLLVEVVDFGAVEAGAAILAAVRRLPALLGRRRLVAEDIAGGLVAGSWRRLVYGNPDLPAGAVDKAAYAVCVLEQLHRALRRRDVYVRGADRWGDPRARLLDGHAWEVARPRTLEALGLTADPGEHLGELAGMLDAAYRQLADGLPANAAVEIRDGRLRLERLRAAPEPAALAPLRELVAGMLPRLDFPELLLEVVARAGLGEEFTHVSGAATRMADLEISLCALLVAEACNVGLAPVAKAGVPALTRARLTHVDQAYLRTETIGAANARLVAAQSETEIVRCWGGGLVASADGLRLVVPVRTINAGPNPRYFGRRRGATWLNVVNDQVMGIGGVVVPGTLRDSLFILDAIHNRDGGPRPEVVITDTASYSDIVFGLFAICGYQFSPRIADLTDTRLWRIDTATRYGPLDDLARHRIQPARIRQHWEDMLRVAGSLSTGEVRAYDLMRMLARDGRPTGLGDAFAHYGRVFKTLHVLQFLHDESYRRLISGQLNVQGGAPPARPADLLRPAR